MSEEDWQKEWKDYYLILGVDRNATQEEIKSAFYFYAKKIFPDKVDKTSTDRATREAKKFNEAYSYLKDPNKRKQYNLEWDRRNQSNSENDNLGQSANIKPKPFIEPPNIYLGDAEAGEIIKTSFIIRNEGGPFEGQIYASSFDSWIRVIDQYQLDPNDKLPYRVDIEVQGTEWDKTYRGDVFITLDNEVISFHVELKTKSKTNEKQTTVPSGTNVGRTGIPSGTTVKKPDDNNSSTSILVYLIILMIIGAGAYYYSYFSVTSTSSFDKRIDEEAQRAGYEGANYWFYRGEMYSSIEPYKAIQAFDKAMDIDPRYSENAELWITKGWSLMLLYRYDEAIQAYYKVVEIEPRNADVWTKIGLLFLMKKDYDNAIQAYDMAEEIDPQKVDYDKVVALSHLKRTEDAVMVLDKLIKLNPEHVLYLTEKAGDLIDLGRYDEAIQVCNKAIKMDPSDSWAWNNKAVALGKQGKYDEAIRSYDKAIEIAPKNTDFYNNKGLFLMNRGEYDEAIRVFDEIIGVEPSDSLDPTYVQIWNNKANILISQGKTIEAIVAYAKAQKLAFRIARGEMALSVYVKSRQLSGTVFSPILTVISEILSPR